MTTLTGYLALICGALIGGIYAYMRGHSAGKTAAKTETQAGELKAIQTAKGIENEVDGLNNADLDKRYDKWVRK